MGSPTLILVALLLLQGAFGRTWARSGDVDPGFAAATGPDQRVLALAVQSDQRVVCAGDFANVGSTPRSRIARLKTDGTLDPTFDPGNGGNGSIYAVAIQPDGRILAAGSFTQVRNDPHLRVARFNADGTLDPNFDVGSGPNSDVYAIVLQPDGDIIIGGAFTSVAGQPRTFLARLKANGTLDPTFAPQLNAGVSALGRAPDGKLVAGGDFTWVAGAARSRVARFTTGGTLDPTFDPAAGPNSSVRALVIQPDGKIVIGGSFSDVNGSGRSYLCRLDIDGLPDLGHSGTVNSTVHALALQADGRLLAGGDFTMALGLPAPRLTRLLGDGNPDPSFNVGTGPEATVFSIAVQTDGNLVAGGAFTQFSGPNHLRVVRLLGSSGAVGGDFEFSAPTYAISEGQPGASIEVRRNEPTTAAVTVDYATANGTATATDYTAQTGTLSFAIGESKKTFVVPVLADATLEDDETVILTLSRPTGGAALGGQRTAVLTILNDGTATDPGGVDTGFATGASGLVYGSAVQADGNVLVVGDFAGLPDGARLRVARLDVIGRLDTTFNPAAWLNGSANAVAVQLDGRILVGGTFTIANGITRVRLVRYNADGTIDPTFNPGFGANSSVYSILVQPDGEILVGGAFSTFGNDGPPFLVRLFSDGNLDPNFNARLNGAVLSLARTSDGKVVIGGEFTFASGVPRNRVARLFADGSVDPAFDPAAGPNSTVRALVLQPDGKIVIGGSFSDVNAGGHGYLCRLDPSGLPDPGFVGTANSTVYSVALQEDGKVLAGGDFTSMGNVPVNGLTRVLDDGTPDPSFNVGTGANGGVYTLAIQPGGYIVVGGGFPQYNGLNRPRLVRVLGQTTAPGGEIEFSAGSYGVSESQPGATIEVRRTGSTTVAVTVDFATANGTANAGDYTPQSGKLSFGIGETRKTFTVPFVADTLVEDDETVILTLSNPTSGAVLGGHRKAVLTILNDDISTAIGSLDTFYPAGAAGPIYAAAQQSDGKLVMVGDFPGFVEGARLRVARLNANGTLDNTFNPAAWLSGAAGAVAVQSDGRILVGGSFTIANGITRNRLARFNADGTLDASFNPGFAANSTVYSLLIQPNGDVLVGGAFNPFDGEGPGFLARVFSDGNLDPSFNVQMNGAVWVLARAADGKWVAGGEFTSVLGMPRYRIARFNADGALDGTFDPALGPNSVVRTAVVQEDGMVIIGGAFSDVNGTGHGYLCRLNTDGLPDLGFTGTGNSTVHALALQSDGKVLAGGDFTSMAGLGVNRIARLLTDGTLDPSFNVGTAANSTVFTLTPQPDGSIVAGGAFTQFNGLNRLRIARLRGTSPGTGGEIEFSSGSYAVSESQPSATIEVRRNGPNAAGVTVNYSTTDGTANAGDYTPQFGQLTFGIGETKKSFVIPIVANTRVEDNKTVNLTLSNPAGGAVLGGRRSSILYILNDDNSTGLGGVDAGFTTAVNGIVYGTAIQPDGLLMVVGEFFGLLDKARLRIARLQGDGTLDKSFDPSAWLNNTAETVAVQSDRRVLVGGSFTVANGITRTRIARFNPDGTIDTTFNPGIGPNSSVHSLLVQPDGQILVGGGFTTFNNEGPGYVARLYSDGNLDPGFNLLLNGPVFAMAYTPDGKLVLGGEFTSALGNVRNRVARFNADGTLDTSFDPQNGPNSTVRAIVVQSDNKVIIGGFFSDVNKSGRGGVVRLTSNGLPDPGHAGTADAAVYALALLSDNKLLIGGDFTTLSGLPAKRLMQLLPGGTQDPAFNVGAGANSSVYTLALQPDGGIIGGGNFTLFDGLIHPHIVRLRGSPNPGGVRYKFTSITSSPGQIDMVGAAGVGQSYRLEYSLDLATWIGIITKTAAGPTLDFTDSAPAEDNRSYRVKSL